MAETIQLEIVTPERLVVNDTAEEIQIPGKSGFLGILPGHAPLITELAVGEISYRSAGQLKRLAVAWGFAEVLPNKVTILAETAERAEEIDVNRAQTAKQRAEETLRKAGPGGDPEAQAAFSRASTRIDVASKTPGAQS
jgi:F-type H+-transporting ATPase subunit epsilon